jgi:hypothetical protein
MPKSGCEVRLVDEAERETAPIAFYQPATLDGSRPGTYWVNPLGATERSRTLSEVTAFHEAVPGHHYQLSIAAETDMHNMRRFAFIEAYLEGWGLYTERLADEMGLYSSDEQRLGMLGLDAMRAGRLVVDARIADLARTDGLRVTVDGDAADVLARLPGVRSVREDGNTRGGLRRYLVEADATLAPELARALAQTHLALHALEPNRQDLETVFARVNSEAEVRVPVAEVAHA